MSFLRQIVHLCIAMLFAIFGTNMSFAMPMAASDISYYQTEATHFAQTDYVGFAARAPPLAVPDVEVTGGVTVMHGSAFALHGQATHVASLGFGSDLAAPNRIVPDEFLDQADLDRFANLRNEAPSEGFFVEPR